MIEITSLTNETVKETAKLHQKKFREETGLFLLEGKKPVEEAIFAGVKLTKIFVETPDYISNLEKSGAEIIKTNAAVLKKISTTDTPPSIVAVGLQKPVSDDWICNAQRVVLLEGIKDAGNLGTILRAASAFGIDGVILYKDTVDIYNPKCVRSSVGNLWKNNISVIDDFNKLKELLKDFTKIGTLPKSDNSVYLNDYEFSSKSCVFFGSEADGLSDELKGITDTNVTIEMTNSVESLNLSLSAGIIMYKMRLI